MAKVELSRKLSISADEAWAHVADLSSLGEWLEMHQGWRSELPDELGVGSTIVGVAGAKGMRNRVTWTVKEFDPPKQLGITGEGVGGTKYALNMTVKSLPTGCEFKVKIDLGGKPYFGPLGMAASRAVKGDIERSIEKFEALYA